MIRKINTGRKEEKQKLMKIRRKYWCLFAGGAVWEKEGHDLFKELSESEGVTKKC